MLIWKSFLHPSEQNEKQIDCVGERERVEKETTGDESNQLMEIQLAVQFHVLLTLKTMH